MRLMKSSSKVMEMIQGKGKIAEVEQKQCCGREEQIQRKAYELYEKRGCRSGHDLEDWLEAEKAICK
jgi:hypothetical protein